MSSLESKGWQRGSGRGEMEDAPLAITIKPIHFTGIVTYLTLKEKDHKKWIFAKKDCLQIICRGWFCFPHVWKSQENPLYIRLLHSQNIRSQDVSVRVKCFVFSFSFEKHSLFVFLQSVTFNLDWIDAKESSGKCSGFCWLQQN